MNNNKTLINFIVEDSLLKRIEDFRFKNRFPSRAGAIKWLLESALKQKPSLGKAMVEEEDQPAPTVMPEAAAEVAQPAVAVTERATAPSRASMLQALRDQGFEVSEAARHPNGQERILVRSQDRSAWVNVNQELPDLAAARATLAEIAAKRAAGR